MPLLLACEPVKPAGPNSLLFSLPHTPHRENAMQTQVSAPSKALSLHSLHKPRERNAALFAHARARQQRNTVKRRDL